jgi:hypothetical protein
VATAALTQILPQTPNRADGNLQQFRNRPNLLAVVLRESAQQHLVTIHHSPESYEIREIY